ncbi:MAG: hypothetical protein HDR03_09785 [Lachnospiraceae bacterium]|nr:hypothetical protein [Lachnospiraceae bacterium]
MQLKVRKQWIQILVLTVIGIVFYLCLGQEWITLEDDSPSYMYPSGQQGVMPVYPLFLYILKRVFGQNLYLDAAVVIQSILAIICTIIFVLYLQKQFQFNFAEAILLYIASMLPFSIYLPESGITHYILTEGLSYALFYLYFIFLMQYIFEKKTKWLLCTMTMSVFMESTRSQLIFLMAITAAAFIGVEFAKHKECNGIKKAAKTVLNIMIGAIGAIVMVMLVYKIYGFYLKYQMPVIEKYNQAEATAGTESSNTTNSSTVKSGNQRSTSQFTTLIVIRGVYEIDEGDIALFDTVEMQEIFQRVFTAIDEKQYRYVYARQDLYMWKDLVIDRISLVVSQEINAYLEENPDVSLNVQQVRRELGMKILLRHFDRYLYHSLRLMISSFIASVFFQIEKIYLLCHIITLLLFAIDIIGIIYCLKRSGRKKVAVFALTTLVSIFLMVIIINLVFVGFQRYMVYAMGIFYCSLYLLAKEVLFTAAGLPDEGRTWLQLWKKISKR